MNKEKLSKFDHYYKCIAIDNDISIEIWNSIQYNHNFRNFLSTIWKIKQKINIYNVGLILIVTYVTYI